MPIGTASGRILASGGGCLLGLALHAADIAGAASGVSTNGFRPLVAADRVSEPVLAPASREGEIRIKQFRHAPELKVDLWAAEPMLANPVAFSVDERGRVFTSETYRYRTSVLDIRHYMFMLEDDLASRSIEDRLAMVRKWFGPGGERALSTETEVVRVLEDTDGNGTADRSEVFAEGFTSPLSGIASGVLARRGEVWVTEIPSLWKFRAATAVERDTLTRDSSASLTSRKVANPADAALASWPHTPDRRIVAEELLRGFGVRFSFTGHDLHGLIFGPDGRLYFSCGDRGAHVTTREGTVIDLPDEGAVFRCEPDGSHLEVVHRGLRNPQELAFNEYGDLFTGDNDSDQGDRERWVQVVEGADSGWRVGYQHAPLGDAGMWNLERLWVPHFEGQAAYLMPPIANIADGPGGLVYDATHRYGPQAGPGRDTFLLAYFKGTSAKSGLYSLRVEPRGAGYGLVGHDEFLWNSLVPDVDLAPDGSVFFADWHEGWPKSNKGRIYRATLPAAVGDPVLKQTAVLLWEGMKSLKEKELLDLLAFPDMRVRQEAQFELAARGPESFEGLKQVALESKSRLARIHALWALGQLGRRPTSDLASGFESVMALALDNDPEIRRHALRMIAAARLTRGSAVTAAALRDPDPRVVQAAMLATRDLWSLRGPPRYATDSLESVLRSGARALGREPEILRRLQALDLSQDATRVSPLRGTGTALDRFAMDPVLRTAAVGLLAAYARSMPPGALDTSSDFGPTASSVARRQAQLLALRSMPARETTDVQTLSRFLSDPDPLLVLEAARAINDVPITNALPRLAALAEPAKLDPLLQRFASLRPENSKLKTENSAAGGGAIRDVRSEQPLPWGDAPPDHLSPLLLRVVNANFRTGTSESAERLAALAARTDLPERIRTEALHGLATWATPAPRDRIVGVYRPLPPRDAAPAREALQRALPGLLALQSPPPLTPDQQAAVDRAKAADPDFEPLDTRFTTATPAPVLVGIIEAVQRLSPPDSHALLFRLVASQAPGAARVAALTALADGVTSGFTVPTRFISKDGRLTVENPGGDPGAGRSLWQLGVALQLASQATDESLRLEASRIQALLNPEDAAGALAAQLRSDSIAGQQAAYATLGTLKSAAADALLAESLDRLMKREVPNEVLLDLVLAAGQRDSAAVKSRLAAYQEWKLPKDHLSPHREALFGGDAERGRKIFYENAAVACTRCHQIGSDAGGNAGPKLDGLSSRATREHLLESIVFPNQQITEGYESAMITLRDGTAHAGVVRSETGDSLTLLEPEEGEVIVRKADIVARDKGPSGMPEGFSGLLTPRELRDLVEFLGTLR